jgi:glycerol kinase
MKRYVLAIDQGTSSSRAILFDKSGRIRAMSQREIPMIYEQEGYVEQNAYDIWSTVLSTMADCLIQADVSPDEVASIGITNQRETTVLWDRRDGRTIYKAIVWQSRQSASICDALNEAGHAPTFHDKTGLLIDPYFSGTKIKWVLDHVEGARQLMEDGHLMFGTVDSWLLYKLTGHQVHKTDHTNASRTLLYNIFEQRWDDELLDILGIDASILPEVCDSNSQFGTTTTKTFFGYEVPITGVLGDQQAALFGQLCLEPGAIKNTYGTGCFTLMNTGTTPTLSQHGLLTTIAYSIDGTITYALEGSVFVAGSAIQWLRDKLEFFKDSSESETLATSVPSHYGVYVVPAFVGLGTPYWDSNARGAIFGLTRNTSPAHITRATLESLAFQSRDVIEAMVEDSGIRPTMLKVDGGASANDFLMQFQADLLDVAIERPLVRESTALGAAYMSGLSSGFYPSIDALRQQATIERRFTPQMDATNRKERYDQWRRAVDATRRFR